MAVTVTANSVRIFQGYPEGRLYFLQATVVGADADQVTTALLNASSGDIPSTAVVANGTFQRTAVQSGSATAGTYITINGQTAAGTVVIGGNAATDAIRIWEVRTGLTATINVWLVEG